MAMGNKAGTGHPGLDRVIDLLRLGDNVVWQVQSVEAYRQMVALYIRQAKADGRRLVYIRFGSHPPLIEEEVPDALYAIDPSEGFEAFATAIHAAIEGEGRGVFYVFDCLSDLLEFWYSDLMIGNFFRVTCPFLYQLDTVAYFALLRGIHTHGTIARIRETTQLLLDVYTIEESTYIHPLKVWERYSLTMFFPHRMQGEEAVLISSSADAAALFASLGQSKRPRDYWELTLERAHAALDGNEEERSTMQRLLIGLMMGSEHRMAELAQRYFTLEDLLYIASREIGTGRIGGKSVGMLLGRKILRSQAWQELHNCWESHDSYYLGADLYYTYMVQNGLWELRTKQRTPEGYFTLAPALGEGMLQGRFSEAVREQFMQMLEHYGQSPIIVRSSSLLEDNFGNAFAGKYESVFCANQGTPEERCQAFEQAVRTVYASTMSEEALAYRRHRGLTHRDEQMAVLVQRVSGDHYGKLFFPHVAGVGNSVNLYVWDQNLDPQAGMLRLVLGLGTRAVDRVPGDYAHIVALDRPSVGPPVNYGDERKFSQHDADVLDLAKNCLTEVSADFLGKGDLKTDKTLFFSADFAALSYMRERGESTGDVPRLLYFHKLLTRTRFPKLAATVLNTLSNAYEYPVDIEFTVNFTPEGELRFHLLQCRPLQTRGLGRAVEMPSPPLQDVFFSTTGNFMGGNASLPFDYVVLVKAQAYVALSEQEKYSVARLIGELNQKLKGKSVLLAGPGRWGTTTPSLGVPVHFSELCNMAAVCEISYQQGGLMPELSFGSHFFQDIVESGIFYAAIFAGEEGTVFRPEAVVQRQNCLSRFLPGKERWEPIVHLAETQGMSLYSDIASQKLLCAGTTEMTDKL